MGVRTAIVEAYGIIVEMEHVREYIEEDGDGDDNVSICYTSELSDIDNHSVFVYLKKSEISSWCFNPGESERLEKNFVLPAVSEEDKQLLIDFVKTTLKVPKVDRKPSDFGYYKYCYEF